MARSGQGRARSQQRRAWSEPPKAAETCRSRPRPPNPLHRRPSMQETTRTANVWHGRGKVGHGRSNVGHGRSRQRRRRPADLDHDHQTLPTGDHQCKKRQEQQGRARSEPPKAAETCRSRPRSPNPLHRRPSMQETTRTATYGTVGARYGTVGAAKGGGDLPISTTTTKPPPPETVNARNDKNSQRTARSGQGRARSEPPKAAETCRSRPRPPNPLHRRPSMQETTRTAR